MIENKWFLFVIRDGNVHCFIRESLDLVHREISTYFSDFDEIETEVLEYIPMTKLNELDNSYFVINGFNAKLFTKIGTVKYRNE